MSNSAVLTDRALLAVSGTGVQTFLQGLITNDIARLSPDAPLYAALLTPQGKILFDFLLYQDGSAILLDCEAAAAASLGKRLSLYRLRAKVDIAARDDLAVMAHWGSDERPPDSWADPRLAALGARALLPKSSLGVALHSDEAYTRHRLDLGVPEGHDFGENTIFALDADLEELHGVAFDKGCYVGQELTARMKHRSTARKRLMPVDADGAALPAAGSGITAGDREIGTLMSVYHDRGFALVRLDRLAEATEMVFNAAGIPVRIVRPAWLFP